MKKLIASALFAFVIVTGNAYAGGDVKAEATELARQLIAKAELNESEYIKVRAYTIEKLEKVAEIKSMYSNDPQMMAYKIAEAENNYNYKLQSALNAKQFASFIDYTNGLKTNATAIADVKE